MKSRINDDGRYPPAQSAILGPQVHRSSTHTFRFDRSRSSMSPSNQRLSVITRNVFGAVMRGVVWATVIPLGLVHRVAMKLDDWMDPSLDQVAVQRPLFVVGLPRSGTTFAHRLLASDRQTFTTMPLWEVLFAPALCQKRCIGFLMRIDRRFGGPLARCLRWAEDCCFRSLNEIHATRLTDPEEDYLGLIAFDGCFLRVLLQPHSQHVWDLGHFSDRLSPQRKQRLIDAYRRLVIRHLKYRGGNRRLLSKNPCFTAWLPELADAFPDASFIGLRRCPEQAVPSQLSSIDGGLRVFGHRASEPEIVDRFVDLLASYWDRLRWADHSMPQNRFVLIEYAELTSQPSKSVTGALDILSVRISESGMTELRTKADAAAGYQSRHHYDLGQFGLDAKQLSQRFQFDESSVMDPKSVHCDDLRPVSDFVMTGDQK
ncbi:hypothetical protein Pan14r_33350 [Crateriforma conspicua]|uniref:Sulfotransferase domain protein n=2 Tax=Crateriforma conspicua TaxID=2527996 RepID=A0A5C5Y9M8_9PLAN|nr:hypothetical protein Pan14r_33350 [Crateriforma conspicua]